MNDYERVERIIELTEKEKIRWRDWKVNYQGWYKGKHLIFRHRNQILTIHGIPVNISSEQVEHLKRAIMKNIVINTGTDQTRRLREIDDILERR